MNFKVKSLMIRPLMVITLFVTILILLDSEPTTKFFKVDSDGCALDNVDLEYNPLSFLKPMSAYMFPIPTPIISCKEMANVTKAVFTELITKEKLIQFGSKSLCIGEGTVSAVIGLQKFGFLTTYGMNRYPALSLKRKRFDYQLEYEDGSFDFVFSSDVSSVSVPAKLVLEIERVVKSGGIGAMLVYSPGLNQGNLMKFAAPVSLFLKSSEVVRVSSVHRLFSLVVFRKKIEWVNPFGNYRLPEVCPSITRNKPFIEHLEPLMEDKDGRSIHKGFSYLSKLMNTTATKRVIYIDIGAGQFMNSNTTNWFLTTYPVPTRAVDVYVVDHNTTVLSSIVNRPGITFVYHPGLTGTNASANVNPVAANLEFNFLAWFKETVAAENTFVVLRMNAMTVELQILHELFESGGICLVDELFLRGPDSVDLVRDLRSTGVFVHQWLDE